MAGVGRQVGGARRNSGRSGNYRAASSSGSTATFSHEFGNVANLSHDELTLLETDDFVDELRRRIPTAKHRIFVQLMTFDGDDAGREIAALLEGAAKDGIDVRLLVDRFALHVVSDQSARRKAVAGELASTKQMFAQLRESGAALKFTHPFGPANVYSLARNHKKIFVIDDHAYLGGINISDHNFEWRDFMVRVDNGEVVQAVVDDFAHTFNGGRTSASDLIVTNEAVEQLFDSLVSTAERSVILASPYAIDIEFARLMKRCPAKVKALISPRRNNIFLFRAMTPFINERLKRADVELQTYRRFSHAKFLLVDDDKLLIGSSNYGRHSFWCNQEIGLLITDTVFIEQFKATMLGDEHVEPLIHRPSRLQLLVGAIVSYWAHSVAHLLRLTIAQRVPNLSSK